MAGTHRWNGQKTKTGKERCSRCGLLREAYIGTIRKPILTSKGIQKGTYPVRVKRYNYYRGNKYVDQLFGHRVPACTPPKES